MRFCGVWIYIAHGDEGAVHHVTCFGFSLRFEIAHDQRRLGLAWFLRARSAAVIELGSLRLLSLVRLSNLNSEVDDPGLLLEFSLGSPPRRALRGEAVTLGFMA